MGSEALVSVGDVVAGKYKVARLLGAGGMGIVVEAEHLELGRSVALKFLRPDAAADTGAAERFLREARAAARIRSEHVARVLDVARRDGGAPFMVMEYLEGRDLGQVIAEEAPVEVSRAVGYLLQACEAIAEAHALGIVHRDLKPSNIFVSTHADGTPLVKVLDFGISKALGEGAFQGDLTNTGVILGSPLYMSPEQLRSTRAVDARTDIWSLGVVLFELLTGKHAFDADAMPTLCAMIAADAPLPLRERGTDFPEEIEAVILQCLEKDPAKRFRTVGSFATALLPFAGPEGLASVERIVRVVTGNEATVVSLGEARASARPSTPTLRRRRVTFGALGLLAVVVVATFVHLNASTAPTAAIPDAEKSETRDVPPARAERPPVDIAVAAPSPATPASSPAAAASVTTLSAVERVRTDARPRAPRSSSSVSSVSSLSSGAVAPGPRPKASASVAPAASPTHPPQGELLDPLVDQR